MPLQTYHTNSQLPIYPENEGDNSIVGGQLCKWPRVLENNQLLLLVGSFDIQKPG
jgi:hypothetical protein